MVVLGSTGRDESARQESIDANTAFELGLLAPSQRPVICHAAVHTRWATVLDKARVFEKKEKKEADSEAAAGAAAQAAAGEKK